MKKKEKQAGSKKAGRTHEMPLEGAQGGTQKAIAGTAPGK